MSKSELQYAYMYIKISLVDANDFLSYVYV